MQTKHEMVHALQSPQKAPFRVAFEIFASTERRDIANWPKKLAKLTNTPAIKFILESKKETFTTEFAETKKAEEIRRLEEDNLIKPADRLLKRLEKHTTRYNKIKEYFDQKIKELGFTSPLIFFDDQALRIDIGYGPKEMSALFPDFFEHRQVFDEVILGCVSFFGKSPLEYFLDDYIAGDYKDFLSSEKERILSSAITEFAKSLAPKAKVTIEKTRGFEEAELIKKCLETNIGLIIGEVHEHKSPKQFLVDNMPLFKSQGITTLYMEHLLQERHQSLLDAYLCSPPDTAMPRELELYLNKLDIERGLSGSATFIAVVQAAKKHQIRIVAVDSEAIYGIGVKNALRDLADTNATKERYSAMNMAMLERYREFSDGQKYIAFIGSGHVSTSLDVPGVSELLSCPNIVVSDLEESVEESIEQDILFGPPSRTTRFDILYHRHQSAKQRITSVVTTTAVAENVDLVVILRQPSEEVPTDLTDLIPMPALQAEQEQQSVIKPQKSMPETSIPTKTLANSLEFTNLAPQADLDSVCLLEPTTISPPSLLKPLQSIPTEPQIPVDITLPEILPSQKSQSDYGSPQDSELEHPSISFLLLSGSQQSAATEQLILANNQRGVTSPDQALPSDPTAPQFNSALNMRILSICIAVLGIASVALAFTALGAATFGTAGVVVGIMGAAMLLTSIGLFGKSFIQDGPTVEVNDIENMQPT